jgi:hypothetical protein
LACLITTGWNMQKNTHNDHVTVDGPLLHPLSRKFFRHWESCRAERACPDRDSFMLAPIADVLPHMFVLDRDQLGNHYTYRLAGTQVGEIFRQSLTGTDALAGWDDFERAIIAKSLSLTATALQPSAFRMRLKTSGNHVVGVEMVAVPVTMRGSSRIQIIGGLFAFCETQSLDYGFIVQRELVSNRLIWTEHSSAADIANYAAQPNPTQLRVIQGGKV